MSQTPKNIREQIDEILDKLYPNVDLSNRGITTIMGKEQATQAILSKVRERDNYIIGEVQQLPKKGDVDPDIYVEVLHRVEGRNSLKAEQHKRADNINKAIEREP